MTGDGYQQSSFKVKHYQPHWHSYAGDIIHNDADFGRYLIPSHCKTRESNDKSREVTINTQHHIFFVSEDFAPIKTIPVDTTFQVSPNIHSDQNEPHIITNRLK